MNIDTMPAGVAMDRAVADALGFRVHAGNDMQGYALYAPNGQPVAGPHPTQDTAWADLPYHFSTDHLNALAALERVAKQYRIERTPAHKYAVQVTVGEFYPPIIQRSDGETLPVAICRAILKGTTLV
jgi:hypothetical protein